MWCISRYARAIYVRNYIYNLFKRISCYTMEVAQLRNKRALCKKTIDKISINTKNANCFEGLLNRNVKNFAHNLIYTNSLPEHTVN